MHRRMKIIHRPKPACFLELFVHVSTPLSHWLRDWVFSNRAWFDHRVVTASRQACFQNLKEVQQRLNEDLRKMRLLVSKMTSAWAWTQTLRIIRINMHYDPDADLDCFESTYIEKYSWWSRFVTLPVAGGDLTVKSVPGAVRPRQINVIVDSWFIYIRSIDWYLFVNICFNICLAENSIYSNDFAFSGRCSNFGTPIQSNNNIWAIHIWFWFACPATSKQLLPYTRPLLVDHAVCFWTEWTPHVGSFYRQMHPVSDLNRREICKTPWTSFVKAPYTLKGGASERKWFELGCSWDLQFGHFEPGGT